MWPAISRFLRGGRRHATSQPAFAHVAMLW